MEADGMLPAWLTVFCKQTERKHRSCLEMCTWVEQTPSRRWENLPGSFMCCAHLGRSLLADETHQLSARNDCAPSVCPTVPLSSGIPWFWAKAILTDCHAKCPFNYFTLIFWHGQNWGVLYKIICFSFWKIAPVFPMGSWHLTPFIVAGF